jgi:hypothetical protein
VTCGSCSNSLGGGSTQNITGALYFPNNAVSYTGLNRRSGVHSTDRLPDNLQWQLQFQQQLRFGRDRDHQCQLEPARRMSGTIYADAAGRAVSHYGQKS